MKTVALALAAALSLTAGAASAQNACAYWNQQMQAADRNLMRQLAGVWMSQEPNGMGGMADVQSQFGPDGTMQYDRRTCLSMEGLGTSCPTSSGYGAWTAHYSGQNGQFFLATNLRTSLSNGQVTQGCGGFNAYLADPNTMVGPNGQVVARRVR